MNEEDRQLFALRYARKYWPSMFRLWPEDAKQSVMVAVFSTPGASIIETARAALRELRVLRREIGGAHNKASADAQLRAWSDRAARKFRAQRMHACGKSTAEIAATLGVGEKSVRANVTISPDEIRAVKSRAGAAGAQATIARRWPGWETRVVEAARLREAGRPYAEIAALLGYGCSGTALTAVKRGRQLLAEKAA